MLDPGQYEYRTPAIHDFTPVASTRLRALLLSVREHGYIVVRREGSSTAVQLFADTSFDSVVVELVRNEAAYILSPADSANGQLHTLVGVHGMRLVAQDNELLVSADAVELAETMLDEGEAPEGWLLRAAGARGAE